VIAVWTTGKGYVSLTGKAQILDDQESKDLSWHPIFSNHFPGGSSDPNYIVVKVSPVSLSYYEEGTMEAQTISLGW
jgi:general stress protein 26